MGVGLLTWRDLFCVVYVVALIFFSSSFDLVFSPVRFFLTDLK